MVCLCLFSFVGCDREVEKEYELLHDAMQITTIEIIEVEELHPNLGVSGRVLATITDKEAFLQDFSQVTSYTKDFMYSVIEGGAIGVKIAYNNGEYEIITGMGELKYYVLDKYSSIGLYNLPHFRFEASQWNALLDKYTTNTTASLIYDVSMVEKVEIVDVGEYVSTGYEEIVLVDIPNVSDFLEAFLVLPCRVGGVMPALEKQARAIKLTYNTQEYEYIYYNGKFACVYQRIIVYRKDGMYMETNTTTYHDEKEFANGVFLFDEGVFNAFLQQYLT